MTSENNTNAADLAASIAAELDDLAEARMGVWKERQDHKKWESQQRSIRRAAGLKARHARKLARNRQEQTP